MRIAISGERYRWDNVAPVLAAICGNTTCRLITRCAPVVFAYAAVLSAQSFTLPAGTAVPVVTTRSLRVADLRVGSSIELATASNIRNGAGINMIPAGTAIHGSVTSVRAKPLAIQVSLDRMQLRDGLNVALKGNPLATRKGKLVYVREPGPIFPATDAEDEATPSHRGSDLFWRTLGLDYMAGFSNPHSESERAGIIPAGHVAQLSTASTLTLTKEQLPADPKAYTGDPIIYVVARKGDQVYCGAELLIDGSTGGSYLFRGLPELYVFRVVFVAVGTQVSKRITAVENSHYVVSSQGTHNVDRANLPAWRDRVPAIDSSSLSFDVDRLSINQRNNVLRSSGNDGCKALTLSKQELAQPTSLLSVPP